MRCGFCSTSDQGPAFILVWPRVRIWSPGDRLTAASSGGVVEVAERVQSRLLLLLRLQWVAGLEVWVLHDCNPTGPVGGSDRVRSEGPGPSPIAEPKSTSC